MPGWSAPGFDDAGWQPIEVSAPPGIDVVPSAGPPVRVVAKLTPSGPPRRLDEWESWWVYDVGANVVGRCKVRAAGPRGSTLVLRHGETLHPDGSVYLDNLGDARQLDAYTFGAHGVEEWEPSFTLHGFRYVQVEAYGQTDPPELSVRVVRSDLERTGRFACSDPLLQSLYANIVRSFEGNLADVPTDCPQRDERLGWTGDLQLVLPAAAYTFDLSRFLSKWLEDLELGQADEGAYPPVAPDVGVFGMTDGGPAWADAAVICAWRHYQVYGDERILRRHYAAMVRYFDYVERTLIDGVRAHLDSPYFRGFGDWLAPADALEACEGGAGEVETPLDLIGTAYLAHVADLMRRIAGTIERAADARRFADAHAAAVGTFRSRFCTLDGRLAVRSQTAHVLALRFGLLDDAAALSGADELVAMIRARGTRLSTGFLGAAHILDVLSDAGNADVAYALLMQTKYPSWLFPVVNGATTVWERWDGWSPEHGFQDRTMNSFNHYVLGAVGAWMYRVIAGIDLDEASPGFRHANLRPVPGGGLTWAEATYETPFGRLSSAWSLSGQRFDWRVTVPTNTTATVHVPVDPESPILEGGHPLGSTDLLGPPRSTDQGVVLEVPGGHYHFSGLASHAE